MRTVVIIPTYNEKENIEGILHAIFSLENPPEILVVDDSSPDGTASLVSKMAEQHPRIHLLVRKTKDGLGQAYLAGFRWAMEKGFNFVLEMDADFSHDPKDIPRLLSACSQSGVDMAVGSRYSSGVNVVNWPMGRVLLSYFASRYVRFVLGIPVKDTTAGFVCLKTEVLQKINIDKIKLKGYGFQVEMKYRAYKKGCNIVEVPIIFTDRTKGESKMNGGIIKEAVFGVLALKMKSMLGKLS